MRPTILSGDLGTTRFRLALVDDAGTVIARHAVPLHVDGDAGGRAEADPDTWWQAFLAGSEALAHLAPAGFARIEAIAIGGMTRSLVLVDTDGALVRPAILWGDTRSTTMAALVQAAAADHPEARHLNAFHPVARLAWLRAQEPHAADRVVSVLEPKDDIHRRLTGALVSDPVSSARLLASSRPGPAGATLLESAGFAASVVPILQPPQSIVGAVRRGLPGALARLAGRPVVNASHDTWTSVVGLGALRRDYAYNITGTTEVFGLITDREVPADGLLTVAWGEHDVQIGGPSQCGGDTIAWFLSLMAAGGTGPVLDDLLARPRDADPLIMLPYLQGERAPHWDAALRGAFVGLNRRHTATDLAYAVLEGVAFVTRTVMLRAEAAAGTRTREIRFGGGGAASAAWAQIKADILDRPVVLTTESDHGLLGAAIAAWTTLGRFPSLADAQASLVGTARVVEPGQRARYDRLYGIFLDAERALAPLSRRLADRSGS